MEQLITTQQLHQALTTRYATKRFKKGEKIPEDKWAALEEAMHLAPTSYGMQPIAMVVIDDEAVREKLRTVSYNQPQITEASKMIVFCARTDLSVADVDVYMARIAEVRGVPVASLSGLKDMIAGTVASIGRAGPKNLEHWASRQAYIALGFLLTSAALLGLDACPMEGFEPSKYNEILGLSKRGLSAKAIATVGVRSQEDAYSLQAKVRFPREKVILHV